MRLLVMGFMVLAGFAGQAQGKAHPVRKGMCPMTDGVIEKFDGTFFGGCRNIGEDILGNDSCVRAVRAGKVQAVMQIGDLHAVMIRCGTLFYTCSDLDTVFVISGQQVAAGDLIGAAIAKKIEFVVSDSTGREFWPHRYLNCQIREVKRP